MKTLTVSDDIYEHLRQHADLGEDASSVLRRLLRIRTDSNSATIAPRRADEPPLRDHVAQLISNPELLAQRSAISRFLGILSWLHGQNPQTFARVESVKGRKRLYFAKGERELAASGVSVNPQQIPGTPYWVATNNDTGKKQEIMRQVLGLLGYPDHEKRAICALLV